MRPSQRAVRAARPLSRRRLQGSRPPVITLNSFVCLRLYASVAPVANSMPAPITAPSATERGMVRGWQAAAAAARGVRLSAIELALRSAVVPQMPHRGPELEEGPRREQPAVERHGRGAAVVWEKLEGQADAYSGH